MFGLWSDQVGWCQTFSDAKDMLLFAEVVEEKANQQTSVKIYEALEEKCKEFKNYKLWRKYFKGHAINSKDYDSEGSIEDLMNLANDDTELVCDPFSSRDPEIGIPLLIIPKDVAEKLLVLGVP